MKWKLFLNSRIKLKTKIFSKIRNIFWNFKKWKLDNKNIFGILWRKIKTRQKNEKMKIIWNLRTIYENGNIFLKRLKTFWKGAKLLNKIIRNIFFKKRTFIRSSLTFFEIMNNLWKDDIFLKIWKLFKSRVFFWNIRTIFEHEPSFKKINNL